MKILVVRNAFSYDFGGAERLAVHIAEELQSNSSGVLLVSRQEKTLQYARSKSIHIQKGWWWTKQNWNSWHVLLLPLYLLWQLVLYVWYLQLMVRKEITTLHILSKDDFIAGTFAARTLGITVIWTDCADLKYIFANHKVWYKNPVGKLVYLASHFAHTVTLVSQSEKILVEEAVSHKLPANFKVIHIAGKDEEVTPAIRKVSDESAIIFSSTSRLVVAKGISELIKAFNLLSSDSSDYRLWLIGDGPDEDKFKDEAINNPYVVFLGYRENPLAYVAASDIFVQPTYHEGFSLSLAEAAMLGKPMIATNVGGNPELVNSGNGILVKVRDVDSLLEAMKRLADDNILRDKLGKNARYDYKKCFDFSQIIKKEFMSLYEKDSH